MKKLSILLILSLLAFVSCTKDFGNKITKPGPDMILDKMQSGKWNNAKANGNNLTINGNSALNGDYTFSSPVLGLGGIYKDGNGKTIMAAPVGDGLAVVELSKEAEDAVNAVLDILDDEGGEKVLGNLIDTVVNGGGDLDLSDPNKILAGTNFPPEKQKEIEDILKSSAGGFGNAEVIN